MGPLSSVLFFPLFVCLFLRPPEGAPTLIQLRGVSTHPPIRLATQLSTIIIITSSVFKPGPTTSSVPVRYLHSRGNWSCTRACCYSVTLPMYSPCVSATAFVSRLVACFWISFIPYITSRVWIVCLFALVCWLFCTLGIKPIAVFITPSCGRSVSGSNTYT